MAIAESIAAVKTVQETINFAFFAFLFEIFLIIMVARLTKYQHNYEHVISNGVIMFMASGTLLFDQRPVGFLLLAYAAFLLAIGVREYEELKFNREEWFGGIVKFFGHYVTVSVFLTLVLIWEYIIVLLI